MALLARCGMAAGILLLLTRTALAQAGGDIDSGNPWTEWELTPDIVGMTLLVLAVYGAGVWRRRHELTQRHRRQIGLFAAGAVAVFLSLQSPVDTMADRLFSMHQVQHMLLRIIGPWLICWAQPGAMLVAGLPRSLRRSMLVPTMRNTSFRGSFGVLGGPVMVTVLFVASLYVWEIPALHDTAVLNEGVHYVMHVTMLAAGLLFFARVFDSRPPPKGLRYGVRMMMLWIAILTSILAGTVTALKPMVLYHAYDIEGRLFGMPALADEQVGGVLIWIPSSMMFLIVIMMMVHAMGVHEQRMWAARGRWTSSNWAAANWPPTASQMIEQTRARNRQMGLGLAGFSASIFVTTIMVGVMALSFGHAGAVRAHVERPVRVAQRQ